MSNWISMPLLEEADANGSTIGFSTQATTQIEQINREVEHRG
jgi:hypothetical protein